MLGRDILYSTTIPSFVATCIALVLVFGPPIVFYSPITAAIYLMAGFGIALLTSYPGVWIYEKGHIKVSRVWGLTGVLWGLIYMYTPGLLLMVLLIE